MRGEESEEKKREVRGEESEEKNREERCEENEEKKREVRGGMRGSPSLHSVDFQTSDFV